MHSIKDKGFKIANAERRTFFDNNKTLDIGPGEYQNEIVSSPSFYAPRSFNKSKEILKEKRNRQRESTYLEDLESSSDEEGSPGHGNYDPYHNSTFKTIQKRRDLQFFGSSDQRFKK
jgi:hypothetical protein